MTLCSGGTVPATLPIKGELVAFLDTDNPYEFEICDEYNQRLDVTGWLADLEVARNTTSDPLIHVECSVAVDPLDATKTILTAMITDEQLKPLTQDGPWAPGSYVYSLKRMNPGNEKILRHGEYLAKQARK